jgi:hypothetical protein
MDTFTLPNTVPDKEKYAKEIAEKDKRWVSCISAVTIMLKTFAGLICLASHPLGLSSFIAALKLPTPKLQVMTSIHTLLIIL